MSIEYMAYINVEDFSSIIYMYMIWIQIQQNFVYNIRVTSTLAHTWSSVWFRGTPSRPLLRALWHIIQTQWTPPSHERTKPLNYYPYRIHVWYIYLQLVIFNCKCRYIYHIHGSYRLSTTTIRNNNISAECHAIMPRNPRNNIMTATCQLPQERATSKDDPAALDDKLSNDSGVVSQTWWDHHNCQKNMNSSSRISYLYSCTLYI